MGNEIINVPYQTWNAIVVRDALNQDSISRFKKKVFKEYEKAQERGWVGSFSCEELAEFFGFELPIVEKKGETE